MHLNNIILWRRYGLLNPSRIRSGQISTPNRSFTACFKASPKTHFESIVKVGKPIYLCYRLGVFDD